MTRAAPSPYPYTRTVPTSFPCPPHPLHVKPEGTLLVVEHAVAQLADTYRSHQLGTLAALPDTLLVQLFGSMDATTLETLSTTSRYLRALVLDEETWKRLCLQTATEDPAWRGSWRSTATKHPWTPMPFPPNTVYLDVLYRPFQCRMLDYQLALRKIIAEEEASSQQRRNFHTSGRIVRIEDPSPEAFASLCAAPFIIATSDQWPSWTVESLADRFPGVLFRQEAVRWPMDSYRSYCRLNEDELPLYLFDCRLEAMAEIRKEYTPNTAFQDDMFLVFEPVRCRPDHLWLIVGPAGSGSTFHHDPNATCAWNATLSGRKLWVMVPPGVTPPGVGADEDMLEVTLPVGVAEWVLSGFLADALRMEESRVGVTFPGEVMYVPTGWWHLVVNIDECVAITQNFVPRAMGGHVWRFLSTRANQVSGFVFSQVLEAVRGLGGTVLQEWLARAEQVNLGKEQQDEDCGEVELGVELPVLALWEELLKREGRDEDVAMVKQQAAELAKKDAKVVKSDRWEQLTTGGAGGFSFGFDESDDEEP